MEILKNFGIQPLLLAAQIVNFLIILFLLKKFFFGPISKVLDDRKNKIAQSLKNVQEIEDKLLQTEEKTAQLIKDAQNSAQQIIVDAKKQAENIAEKTNKEAKESLESTVAEAKKQIEVQKVQMQKELERETLNFVVEVTNKVLGKTLKSKEKQDLTTAAAREITKKI